MLFLLAGESYLIFRFPEFPQSTLGEKHPWDAVSYTHLVVGSGGKGQFFHGAEQDGPSFRLQAAIFLERFSGTVSYTHLDVYKRKACGIEPGCYRPASAHGFPCVDRSWSPEHVVEPGRRA